jgi:hypothetical protein
VNLLFVYYKGRAYSIVNWDNFDPLFHTLMIRKCSFSISALMFTAYFVRVLEDQLISCKLFHMPCYILEYGFKFLNFGPKLP